MQIWAYMLKFSENFTEMNLHQDDVNFYNCICELKYEEELIEILSVETALFQASQL